MYHTLEKDGKLVPVTEQLPEEVIQAIERYDEEAIVRRMTTGIASEEYIYHYPIKTKDGVKEIVGISTDGADELALLQGNIEVLPDLRFDKDTDPDFIYAMVRARDTRRNVTLLGVGRQCKYILDAGNKPIEGRLNEHAFVSSVSKAQRNAILHLTPSEIIIQIIDAWRKTGKSKKFTPPKLETDNVPPSSPIIITPQPPAPTPAITQGAITQQQERLKKLRMEVHNKFQTNMGIGTEKRKGILKKEFGVESLTDLSEQQLNQCLTLVEKMIEEGTISPPTTTAPAPKPALVTDLQASELGFENAGEQNNLRSRLYTLLTSPNELALKNEEAKSFVTTRGFASTSEVPKQDLLQMIQDATEAIKAKRLPSPPSENDIPF